MWVGPQTHVGRFGGTSSVDIIREVESSCFPPLRLAGAGYRNHRQIIMIHPNNIPDYVLHLAIPQLTNLPVPQQLLDVLNCYLRNLLEHRPLVCLAELLPPVHPLFRLDAQRLVALLYDVTHLPWTEVLLASALLAIE